MSVFFPCCLNNKFARLFCYLSLVIACLCLSGCWQNTITPTLILDGHSYNTVNVNFPTNNRVTTRSSDGDVKIWDADTGKPINLITGPYTNIDLQTVSLSFSESGEKVLVWPMRRPSDLLWNVNTGQRENIFITEPEWINQATFLPDERHIATISNDRKTVSVWNIQTGKLVQKISDEVRSLKSISATPDSSKIVTLTWRNATYIWNVSGGNRIFTGWPDSELVFSPDYSIMISRNAERDRSKNETEIQIYELESGQLLKSRILPFSAFPFVFAPDGKTIAYGHMYNNKHSIQIWNFETGETFGPFDHEGGYKGMKRRGKFFFSADGDDIVAAYGDGLTVWDIATGDVVTHIKKAMKPATSHKFSPDKTRLLTESKWYVGGFSDAYYYYLWDAENYELLGKFKSKEIASFSPDGAFLISLPGDKTARVWDSKTGDSIAILKGHKRKVTSADFSPDSKRIVTGSRDRTAIIWDINK